MINHDYNAAIWNTELLVVSAVNKAEAFLSDPEPEKTERMRLEYHREIIL
jgi:hypothetical protein